MKSILEKLYYGEISPCSLPTPTTEQYFKAKEDVEKYATDILAKYLIGNCDKYDNVAYYRIDRMKNVELLDETGKPMKQVEGLEHGLDLPKHTAEHIYMFSGKSVPIKLRCSSGIMDSLADWFGTDIRVVSEGDDNVIVYVKCNYKAMFCWALQFGPFVEVLEPAELRSELAAAINEMSEVYSNPAS